MEKMPLELLRHIKAGESTVVEFKKSTTEISKDVYDTVCSFSNREGGHIFLGVKDDGTVLGIDDSCAEKMKKDFVNTINNSQKLYPPLYLTLEEYSVNGKSILYTYVPKGTTVYRNAGRIYDRNNDSDIDITDNADLVYHLYARKQETFFVNKVYPVFKVSDLRHDLLDRARDMTKSRRQDHPWRDMDDDASQYPSASS